MVPSVGGGETLDADALVELCLAVEAVGFAAVTVTDHPAPLERSARHTGLDPFAALAYIAAATTRLRLHTGVLVLPYRNPFIIAQGAATVQLLSGYRMILGVGVGYLHEEFEALGVRAADRGRLMDEGLQALRLAFRGEPIFDSGSNWTAAGNLSVPSTRCAPPVWIGGNSILAQRRAVAFGEGWMPFETPPGSIVGGRAINGPSQLEPLVHTLRNLEAQASRPSTIDVCFVRPMPAWLQGSDESIEAEVEQLKEIGVSWLVLRPPGESLGGILEGASRFAEIAGLQPPPPRQSPGRS